jgi:7-keto-8-aminopelargonate synthetase-like enzyme
MIRIRFADSQTERRGLAYLAGRFPFKSWANGDTVVPEAALAALAVEGIKFVVKGPPTYEQNVPPLRDSPTAAV